MGAILASGLRLLPAAEALDRKERPPPASRPGVLKSRTRAAVAPPRSELQSHDEPMRRSGMVLRCLRVTAYSGDWMERSTSPTCVRADAFHGAGCVRREARPPRSRTSPRPHDVRSSGADRDKPWSGRAQTLYGVGVFHHVTGRSSQTHRAWARTDRFRDPQRCVAGCGVESIHLLT